MTHITGQSREQATLFPERLDDFVSADHPVRVIDAFVNSLSLKRLGFAKVTAEATGRPPYDPADLLKLYVYGYLNQLRSSRRLEREAERNVEVLWLIRRVTPSFKTIADFRKDHTGAIVGVCRAFIQFCRGRSLYGGAVLAIDGSKIDAVASRKQVITPRSLAKQMAAIDGRIAEYLAAMDTADREEPGEPPLAPGAVAAALEALREQREQLRQQADHLSQQGLTQLVRSEPEARLMRTARHGHQVAYNAQIAVDAEHSLIAAFDLSNDGNDLCQLYPMAMQGREALEAETITVVADTGYSNGEQGQRCADSGIIAVVPRPVMVNPVGEQYFSRDAFSYDADTDRWRCPAGETLVCRQVSQTEQKKTYWTDACSRCALKPRCTAAARRTIVRSFHDEAREAMHQRACEDPNWMKRRQAMVEHPFGTMKWMMGLPRFLLRGLTKAKAELALVVLGFNLKRVISIIGVQGLLQALRPAPA